MPTLLSSLALMTLLGAGSSPTAAAAAAPEVWADRLPGFAAHAAPRFVVLSDLGAERTDQIADVLERTADAVESLARSRGNPGGRAATAHRPILCIAFAERDAFERFAREHDRIDAGWMMGYWAAADERIVVRATTAPQRSANADRSASAVRSAADAQPLLDMTHPCETMATVAHEAAHQMLHRLGLQRASPRMPLAMLEGLAMQFESCASADGIAFAAQPQRERRLVERSDAIPGLRLLLTTPRMPSMEPADIERFYDASWSLVRFLHERDPGALADYLATLVAESETLTRTRLITLFERRFGPTGAVEAAWLRWMRGVSDGASGAGRRPKE
jgi:hypothetical protein